VRRIEDQAGQWQQFERDSQGRVREILTSGGMQLVLDYVHENGRLASITAVRGDDRLVLVTYGHDEQGQLASVTDANGAVVRRFTYVDGLMTSHVNALGFTCSYEWADVAGQSRVVATHTSEGEHWTFGYDVTARESWVNHADGRTARWKYDEQNQIVACTDLDGAQYAIENNDAGMPVKIHLPGDRTVSLEYDEAGRIVAETDPLGRTTKTRYDGNSMRPAETVLPDGTIWKSTYDRQGRLLRTSDPLGRSEEYEYPEGLTAQPVAYIDARGGRKTLEWSLLGQLAAYTDCSGKTTRYDYDGIGNLVIATNALGERTVYVRRPTGEVLRVMLPDRSVERFEYDAAGLPIMHVGIGERIRRWTRNARGQVVEATDPAERRLHYRYDSEGRLTELENDGGARYVFTYDIGDRLKTETRPDGIVRRFSYGAAGDLVSIETVGALDEQVVGRIGAPATEPPARMMRFERDAMGNLLAQTTNTEVTRFSRDVMDRLLEVERIPADAGIALGIEPDTVKFEYDKVGRLVAEHGVNGDVEYTLDELDNIATLKLPHGEALDMLRYGSGHVHQIRSGERVVSDFERDDLHREVMRTQGQLVQCTGYDPLGRRLWQSSALVRAAAEPEKGRLWRSYRYDAAGELAELRDSIRGSVQYRYDQAGQLLRCYRSKDQSVEQFAWDAAGNLIDEIQRKSRGYVEGNRLRMWQDLRFEYDAWGNLVSKRRGANEVQKFVYDAQNRLIAVRTENVRGAVEARFEYDPLGRRTAKTETQIDLIGRKGRVESKRFVWQGLRLAQEVRETGASSYVYSPEAAYAPVARVDMARVDVVVSEALAAVTIESAKRNARVYHFHTDLVGAPLEVTDEAGEVVWAGRYAAWGKVDRAEDGRAVPRIEQPLRYAGQYADESTGLHYNTFRYYDPDVGRFVGQDPIGLLGGSNLYQYAPNPAAWIDPLGWVNETAPGYNVYGLFEEGAAKPYYVGITDDLSRRRVEHMTSGRLDATGEMRPLARNVTYGQARGYEQAYIEHYSTKTGTIGEPISVTNRGNKINSFDHESSTRTPGRQAYFEEHYATKTKQLTGGC
jgi:RHS repeat-associated protein